MGAPGQGGADGLAAASDSASFSILPIGTNLTLTTQQPTFGSNGVADLTINLVDAAGHSLRERTVLLSIQNSGGTTVYSEPIITDLFGNVVLQTVPLAPGTYNATATFGDVITINNNTIDLTDPRYLPSSTQLTLISNTPPTAAAGGPYTVDEGNSVLLDASSSSDINPGQTLTYRWDLDNDVIYESVGITQTFSAATLDGPASLTVGLEVCDVVQECDTTTTTVTVQNVVPTIQSVTNDGPVNQGQPATITVVATDPIDPLSYQFDCDGDSTFEIGPQTANTATCTFSTPGNFTVAVRVSDDDGGVTDGSTIVQVQSSNTPPVADAGGPYKVDEGSSVILDASGSSDPDSGQTLTYRWDLDNDGSYESAGITQTLSAASLDGPTSLIVGLEVCDPIPQCDTDTATVTVQNVAPTIQSVTNDGPVDPGQPATVTVTASDPIDPLSYQFDCDEDSTFEIGPQAANSATCTFASPGNYTVGVRVSDDDGGVTDGSTIVTVLGSGGNRPPIADAGGPYTVDEGGSVVLDASGSSDPDAGQTLTYRWDLDNNGTYESIGITQTLSAASLDGPTSLIVGLEVCDPVPECDTDTANITVQNVAPTVQSVTNDGPVDPGQSVTITIVATDPIDALSYLFDCDGDLVFEIGPQPANSATCTFAAPGKYTVAVQVIDDDGAESHGSTIVTVNATGSVFATCGGIDVFETAPGVYIAPSFVGTLIVGTNGNDWLRGTGGPDLILGLDGHDDIFGKGDDDLICGGSGVDIIKGQGGDDTIYGDAARDWLIGGNGDDILYGGAGRDDLMGQAGSDILYGDAGYDVLLGGSGDDDLFGGNGPDDLYGNKGDDDLDGGNGNDFCQGGQGNDTSINCEFSLSTKVQSEVMEPIDEEVARSRNDGDSRQYVISQRIWDLFLPLVVR
ncbi:PKD domain-containing protein [Chloroflexi bacterium TSY]|nr:PKD domain-containing protein [Chloroflexi bacterium TSY]